MKKQVVVAVSGGFDPLHIGHIRMFQEAKKLGDELVVILNNDHWLTDKKGAPFMSEAERKEIIEAIKGVDRVVVTSHAPGDADRSVCRELREVKPHIFANGGDHKPDGDPVARSRTLQRARHSIALQHRHRRQSAVLFLAYKESYK